jgi:hypothetical protein
VYRHHHHRAQLRRAAVQDVRLAGNLAIAWPVRFGIFMPLKAVYLVYKYLVLALVYIARLALQAYTDYRFAQLTPQRQREIQQRAELRAVRQRFKDAHRCNVLRGERPRRNVTARRDHIWP